MKLNCFCFWVVLFSPWLYCSAQTVSCRDIHVGIQLYNESRVKDSIKVQPSKLWPVRDIRDVPKKVILGVELANNLLVLSNQKSLDLDLINSFKLRYSDSEECLYPINPQYTKDKIILNHKTLSVTDFEKSSTRGIIYFDGIKVDIESLINDIYFSKKYLNSIIITVTLKTISRTCVIEYDHRVCLDTPRRR